MAEAFFEKSDLEMIKDPPIGVSYRLVKKVSSEYSIISQDMNIGAQKYEVDNIIAVDNIDLEERFELQQRQMIRAGIEPNLQFMYHVTPANYKKISKEGLDSRLSRTGFFGKGIYITPIMDKANYYSPYRGNPLALRIVFRCKILLGRCYEYKEYNFDRSIMREPEGYNSIKGFLRGGIEYVIYNNSQCCVTHIITYRVPDSAAEQNMLYTMPQLAPNSAICFITIPLAEFFTKLKTRGNSIGGNTVSNIEENINNLLKGIITPEEFIQNIESLLQSQSPYGIITKLRNELSKCSQASRTTQAQIPITMPAPMATMTVPMATMPAPMATMPAPMATMPAPMATMPAPMATMPAPMATMPAPMATMPAPMATIPAPMAVQPMFNTQSPMPKTVPVTQIDLQCCKIDTPQSILSQNQETDTETSVKRAKTE